MEGPQHWKFQILEDASWLHGGWTKHTLNSMTKSNHGSKDNELKWMERYSVLLVALQIVFTLLTAHLTRKVYLKAAIFSLLRWMGKKCL